MLKICPVDFLPLVCLCLTLISEDGTCALNDGVSGLSHVTKSSVKSLGQFGRRCSVN